MDRSRSLFSDFGRRSSARTPAARPGAGNRRCRAPAAGRAASGIPGRGAGVARLNGLCTLAIHMRYGFVLPGGTAPQQLEQAVLAEESGWDGLFMYEIGYGVEPWTALAAIAQRTSHIKLGTMLTPLPWRRPWKLASQVATLDQLSNDRAILAVGTGAVDGTLGSTGEATDIQTRAARLDEAIDLIYGLWAGKLRFEGNHFNVDLEARRDDIARNLQPVQERIPIWVVAAWPRLRTLRRAQRCD